MTVTENQMFRICAMMLCVCFMQADKALAASQDDEEAAVRVYKPIETPRFMRNDFVIRSLQAEEQAIPQTDGSVSSPEPAPEAPLVTKAPAVEAQKSIAKPKVVSKPVSLQESTVYLGSDIQAKEPRNISRSPVLEDQSFEPVQKQREIIKQEGTVSQSVSVDQPKAADNGLDDLDVEALFVNEQEAPDQEVEQNLFISAALLDPSQPDHVGKSTTTAIPNDAGNELVLAQKTFIDEYMAEGDGQAQATNAVSETVTSDPKDKGAPVDFAADNLQHSGDSRTIIASGNVEIEQDGRILKADEMIYDLENDTVVAKGNVVLTEPSGDVYFADSFTLRRSMKEGFVAGLEGYLSGGGKFTADEGRRLSDKRIVMSNASYTVCECEEDEDGNPAWNIKAKEVTYDSEEHRVYYKNAKFEVFGVPVFYTPRLSHPDNTVKRKSGFLTPSFGYDSDIGANMTQQYYWDIAPDKDATFGVLATTDESPVGLLEYRQRFGNADLQFNGSVTYSDRTDDINGVEFRAEEELRGHVFAEGGWDINEKWRSGLSIEYASDDQYLNQYNFSGEDVLESEMYVERFDDRNYTTARLLAFQDLRILEEAVDQPNILPEIYTSFYGEPNALLGGRWELQGSALGLTREDGQDMNRFIGQAGWQRRYVTGFGLVNTFDASVRGDAYHVTDRDIATGGSGRSSNTTETRVTPRASLITSFPLAKQYKKSNLLIEPVVAMHLAPDIEEEENDIPNEDSQDVQLDISNLFSQSRFPGYDLIEDRSRITYGLRTGLYGFDGSFLRGFIGQSYRLDEVDNPFPAGSGLDRQESDIVGQVAADYQGRYGIDYRFQIVGDTMNSARHEADFYADLHPFHFDARYLFAQALEGTNITESREQGRLAAGVNLTENWHVFSDVIYDLGEDDGLREAWFGIDYSGCCVSYSLSAKRNITDDASGESGTEVMFRMGLKGLGQFGFDDEDRWDAGNR